ncbi:unnamed protein product [Clonostachys rosea]|uniref:Uncharacterized protein n=1 Tax=Bionectria ochroleuca TaxID=29856 RepID=A0ABY6U4G7_BIOOC|nr:unnamed protein product [Clonostachys rosea]
MVKTLDIDRSTIPGVTSAATITIHAGPTSLTTSSVTPSSQANTSPASPSSANVILPLAIALSFTLTVLFATMAYLVWKRGRHRPGKTMLDEMIEARRESPHYPSRKLSGSQVRFDKAELDARDCEIRPPLNTKHSVRTIRSPVELPATPVSRRLEAAIGKAARKF